MACTTGDCAGKASLPISVEPQTLCGGEVYKRFKDAVVTISAIPLFQFGTRENNTLTGGYYFSPSGTTAEGAAPYGNGTGPVSPSGTLALAVPVQYSGFFYERDGYIVSSSAFLYLFVLALLYLAPNVLTDASALNPNAGPASQYTTQPLSNLLNIQYTLLDVVKYIFSQDAPESLVDFFQFFITVFNVNGCGRSYVYKAYVVGVDFATGIAVYKIDACDPWNKCTVCIKKHPFLKFGTSKCYTPGNTAHIIAGLSQQSPQSMASGAIVNNTTIQANAVITYEGVLTDIVVLNGAEGAPILDQCGYVIGVVTGRTGVVNQGSSTNYVNVATTNGASATTVAGANVAVANGTYPAAVGGPALNNLAVSLQPLSSASSGLAFGVSAAFINSVVDRLIQADLKPECSPFVLYNDIFGFNIYRHATLGICYYYRQGSDIGLLSGEAVYPPVQARWFDPAYCEINKQLIGIVLKQDPIGALAQAYEDCRALQFPVFQGKTVVQLPPDWAGFQVQALDLITGINGMPVGQLPTQISPDTLLYQLQPCDSVVIDFQKASEFYTHCHSLCTSLDDSLAFLFSLPNIYNTSSKVIDFTQVTTQNGTAFDGLNAYSALLLWFINSLSQVQIATILSLILDNSQATQVPLFGQAWANAFAQGLISINYDPLNLLNNLNNTLFIPAVDVNVNFLSYVCAGAAAALIQSFSTQLPLVAGALVPL